MAGSRRRRRLAGVAVLLFAVAALTASRLGFWLAYEDPQSEPCQAAAVFGGYVPFRAMEAAATYQEGLAKEVWLTRGPLSDENAAMEALGVEPPAEYVLNTQVLENLHVPPSRINVLDGHVRNTLEEVRLISGEAARRSVDCIVLVTSKAHARRVRIIWDIVAGRRRTAYVRYAKQDPFDPARWWSNTDRILAVARETGGILNALLGFPIATDRQAEREP